MQDVTDIIHHLRKAARRLRVAENLGREERADIADVISQAIKELGIPK